MLDSQDFLSDSVGETATELSGIKFCMINVLQAGVHVGSVKS